MSKAAKKEFIPDLLRKNAFTACACSPWVHDSLGVVHAQGEQIFPYLGHSASLNDLLLKSTVARVYKHQWFANVVHTSCCSP